MRLLLVEDAESLAVELKQQLQQDGYATDIAPNAAEARYLGIEEAYDLCILDLGLPDAPGLTVLSHWRQHGVNVPVLILTARDAWQEKVDGLKAGADDYLTKPFHYPELLARLQALTRRSVGHVQPQLGTAGFTLDEATHSIVRRTGERTELTGTEFRLLRYFLLHPGIVLSKSTLTEHVYEYDAERDSNVIEVYVRRLRDKIGRAHIETRRGQGYVFVAQP